MNIGTAVKDRILELCQEYGITINKLATVSGVTQSTLNNIISGRNNSIVIVPLFLFYLPFLFGEYLNIGRMTMGTFGVIYHLI